MRDSNFKDSRLLEAFDEIDPRFIAEVADELKIEPEINHEHDKRSVRKSLKYVLAIAACALLLGSLIPVMNYVIPNFPSIVSGIFGGDTEQTLDDFVYFTDINTDHVITKRELAVMNRIWRSEFGKDLAATPEEAMNRQENGSFYFGRYGKTFVFYRKEYNMEMEFSWGGHDFVFPWGEFYFLKGEKVYTRDEIASTDIFTDEHIDAFYDYYKNTYLSYKPVITLPKGDYVLTADELAEMQAAFDGPVQYSKFATLKSVMGRTPNSSYYFGKFGDTVIVWVRGGYGGYEDLIDGFELGGYDFDFESGRIYFYENGAFYNHIEAAEKNIMTADEIKEFYKHYTERFIPFNEIPYACPEFTNGIEKLKENEMREINEAYKAWAYDREFNHYYEMYSDNNLSVDEVREMAHKAASGNIGYETHRFFNEDNFENYHYYGKRGNRVFLAVQKEYDTLTVIEIAGYKFVLDGAGCDLIVYEGGKVTDLSEAYSQGLVSKEDIAFAHERHMAYCEYLRGGRKDIAPPIRLKIGAPREEAPISLTDEEVREIVWEYIEDAREEDLQYTYGVRCYGKFGDTYAVMLDGPWGYLQAISTETVAGYTFIYPDAQSLEIYKDGVFYTLREAYELGVISEENVAAIEWYKEKQ